jgi:hypothetical protein
VAAAEAVVVEVEARAVVAVDRVPVAARLEPAARPEGAAGAVLLLLLEAVATLAQPEPLVLLVLLAAAWEAARLDRQRPTQAAATAELYPVVRALHTLMAIAT